MATVSVMGAPPVSAIDMVQIAYLQWVESQENERFAKYAEFRDYYDGEQLALMTKRLAKFMKLTTLQEFSFNYCQIIVEALADKLKVAGFDCGDEKQNKLFSEWWESNRMDGQQGVTHLAATRDGDTYVLVEWDNVNKVPIFTQENAYDLDQGMHLVYAEEHRRRPMVAIKRWKETIDQTRVIRRTNLYWPDRVEKYSDYGTGQEYQPYYDEGNELDQETGEAQWPIPWVDSKGQPLGIPVIHFRNKDQGVSYGMSEIDQVIPVQNALNKTVLDLLAAGDATAFQRPYMTGGKPQNMDQGIGSWIYTTSTEAAIGTIPAADLAGLIELKDSFAADMAKMTRTPLSFFQLTGQVAAAGTLKEQRAGLIAKALDRQTTHGNSWEDVFAMARRLYNTFGPGGMDESKRITTQWLDDEKPDESARADQVNKASAAGAMSVKTKVKTLHPEWDDKQVKEEVKLIRDEAGVEVPVPEIAGDVENGQEGAE